jgi:hypothetical protein
VRPRVDHPQHPLARRPASWSRQRPGPGEVRPGDAGGVGHDLLRGALGDDAPAAGAGPGTHVDQVVRGEDRLPVVLNDQHRVPHVDQATERRQQPLVVPGVEARGGLIQHVEHADERGADLGGQADPLALASAERVGGAIQGEVIQPHVDEETQAGDDRPEQRLGDGPVARGAPGAGRFEVLQEFPEPPQAQPAQVGDAAPVQLDRQRLGPEPLAMAAVADPGDAEAPEVVGPHGSQVLSFLVLPFQRALLQQPCEPRQHSLVAVLLSLLVLHPLEQCAPLVLGELLERYRWIDPQRLHRPGQLGGEGYGSTAPPAHHRAIPQAPRGIRNAPIWVNDDTLSEAPAGGAGAVGAVEGEEAGLQRGQRHAADNAGEALAQHPGLVAVAAVQQQGAFAELEGQLHGVGEAPPDALLEDEAVDHHVEVVRFLPVEHQVVTELDELAVDAGSDKPLAAEPFQLQLELAFAAAGDGGEEDNAGALPHLQDGIDDLLDRLGLDGEAAPGAVGLADPGEEESKIVRDLGDGADGGARALADRLLVDGDGGREPLDGLDVRLGELLQKLSCVGAQALDVAPLSLGVDGVEGQGGFSRAAGACDDHEPVPRDAAANIL